MERYDIGHWLVETFPEVALKPYSGKLPDFEEFKDDDFTDDMMPYTGENILHMVIVRRNYKEVRWLLDFFKDHKDSVPNGLERLLTSNATGGFFNVKGDFYFGGYPLQFAVCSNSIEIFDLVLSFASSIESNGDDLDSSTMLGPNVIFMRDSFGNTVLHLCVIHCLQEMFEHVYKTAERMIIQNIKVLYSRMKLEEKKGKKYLLVDIENCLDKQEGKGYSLYPRKALQCPEDHNYLSWLRNETNAKMEECLLLVLNKDYHSPLTLAAALLDKKNISHTSMSKRIEIFKYLLKSIKVLIWKFGPIECSEINLQGLEIKFRLSHYKNCYNPKIQSNLKSAIQWLCINQATEAIVIPEIRRIIEMKWERCGYGSFLRDFILDLTIIPLITLILVFSSYSPTSTPKTGMEWFIDILYVAILAIFLFIVITEVIPMIINQLDYRKIRGKLLLLIYITNVHTFTNVHSTSIF